MLRRLAGIISLAISLVIAGCSQRTTPAPLVVLNSQPDDGSNEYTAETYTVRQGDTLYAIAWYTGNDYRDIAKYNNLSAPFNIYPGQTLRVKPIKLSSKTSISQARSSKKQTGTTTHHKAKNIVDPPKEQAYGESEKNVNNQSVKPVPNRANRGNTGFPERVAQWVWPAKGKLVGRFDKSANGPKGIDIQAAKGTAIYAAADGKVVYAGSALRGYGKLVIIKHTDTFLSAYAHNDTIEVNERQWVKAGDKIATMGDSGTNSVKLHFEVRYRGKSLDPLRYLPSTTP